MTKPKFRYNCSTQEWSEIFRFSKEVGVITGYIFPSGTAQVLRTRYGGSAHQFYLT